MTKRGIEVGTSVAISTLFFITMLSTTVSAVEPVGNDFTGNVYRDGANAPVGVEVRAEVDGTIYGRTGTSNPGTGTTVYLMGTEGDDPATPQKDGIVNGEVMVFWVENMVCDESYDDWQEGQIIMGIPIPTLTIMDLHYSSAGQPALLKINEIMPNPEYGNEWVELYNPTSSNVNLNSYSFWKNDGSIPGTKIMDLTGDIQANGWYVVDLGLTPVLNDAGHDEIKLVWTDPGGVKAGGNEVVIDRVEFGSASTGPDDTTNSNVEMGNAPMPSVNVSIELEPDGDETNHPNSDFTLSSRPTSTKGYTNTQIQPLITVESPPAGTTQADFNFLITWTDDDPDDNATIRLYYDDDDMSGNEIFICTVPQGEDSTDDSYLWDASTMIIGNYYIKAEIDDGINPLSYDYSEGRVAVVHPPHIIVTQPDGISDFADWNYIIQWQDHDSDDNATITLYYDTDNIVGGENLIGSGPIPQGEDPDGGLWDSCIWNTTLVAEGDYYIKATIYDGITAVYNYSSGVVSIGHPPYITILEPDGIEDCSDTSYTIRWTDWDADGDAVISLYYDSDDFGHDGTLIESGLSEDDPLDEYVWDTSMLPEGSNWYIYANITHGSATNFSYSVAPVTITHPPSIQLVEPDDFSDLADRQYTIRWEDHDTDDNATITLYYDGDSTSGGEILIGVVPQGEDPDGDGDTFVWDTTHMFEGLYYIKAVINDSTSSSYVYSLGRLTVLHNKTPSITLISPSQDVYASDLYLITWVDGDPDDNATITLYYDDDPMPGSEILIGIVPQGEDSPLDSYLWDVSTVADGSYYIKSEIHDGVNQVEYDYSSGRIIVDKTPPLPPELGVLGNLTGNSSLILGGEAEPFVWVDVHHNNVLVGTVMADQDGRFTFSLTLYEGRNWFYAVAKDDAGNAGGQSQIEETFLDTTPPTALITYISSLSIVQWREITLIGEGVDGTPIVNYEWYSNIDGYLGSSSRLITSSLSKGSHTIYFKVKDKVGLWSEPAEVSIEAKENIAPILDAGPDMEITLGDKAFFSPKILDSDGPIIKYEWDFDGDEIYDWNSTQNGNVFFEYEENGTYQPSLRATDIDGNQSTDSLTVKVIREEIEDEEKSEEGFEFLELLLILIVILLLINVILQLLSFKKMRSLISETSQKIEREVSSDEEKSAEEPKEMEAQKDETPPPEEKDPTQVDETPPQPEETDLTRDEETLPSLEEREITKEDETSTPQDETGLD